MAKMKPPPALLRSYASDDAANETPQWMLFVRQEAPTAEDNGAGAFVFTAIVPSPQDPTKCALYERRLDGDTMEQHIDELGIEVDTAAFGDLLLTTLSLRDCVDVAVASASTDDTTGATATVVLTYKFSASISRKGRLDLTSVASSLPMAVATLLLDLHSVKSHESMLTPLQKLQNTQPPTQKRTQTQNLPQRFSLPLSQESTTSTTSDGDVAAGTSSTNANDSTPTTSNASAAALLKRRHIPTGTARRKGPRGAKLAKLQ